MAVRAAKGTFTILLGLCITGNSWVEAQELEFVGSCTTPGNASRVSVSGDYAYISESEYGLRIVSIADPANPVIVGSYDSQSYYANNILAENEYAYLVGSDGLEVINVSDPLNPSLAGSYSTLDDAFSIFLHGNQAYVGGHTFFEIIDIADPTAPDQVGYFSNFADYACVTGIFVAGEYVYITSNACGLFCMYGWCSFDIFNIGDPTLPAPVSSLAFGDIPSGIFVADDYAYLSAYYPSLTVIDISDPTYPGIIGDWSAGTGYPSHDVFVAGSHAFIAGSVDGVYVISITDPANPSIVASYNTPLEASDIYVVGDYVYVTDHTSFIILRFINVLCDDTYTPGDCNGNGVALEMADVIAMIGMYRGNILPNYTCNCSPHGNFFAPYADPDGNCVAFELNDVVTEIGAYRGSAPVSGCADCPPMD